jgi:hypothetical protein
LARLARLQRPRRRRPWRMLRWLEQVHPLVASPFGSSVRKPNLVREYSHFSRHGLSSNSNVLSLFLSFS